MSVAQNLRENIISVSQITDLGYDVVFSRDRVVIRDSDSDCAVATGSRDGGLYKIPLRDILFNHSVNNIGSTAPDVDQVTLFHQRTGDHST